MPKTQASHAYQKLHHQLYFFTFALDLILLSIFFFSGLSLSLRQWTQTISVNSFVMISLYFLVFSVGMYLIHLPLNFYSGYIWEHRFKLSKQKFKAWMIDQLKGGLLGFVIALIFIEALYFSLGRLGENWWVWAACFWMFLSFVLAKITPNLIMPLFYKYQTLSNPSLKARIFKLFQSCDVSLKDVYMIDMSRKTKKANAFLCGVGKSRRVVLSDTLLNEFNEDEVEVVVAHELGHLKHGDIIKMLFIQAAFIFGGLFLIAQLLRKALIVFQLESIDDVAFLPGMLLVFMIFSFILQPILNAYSRKIERAADRYSLEKTSRPQSFIMLMFKLGEMNLSEFLPSRFIEIFMYDHPPIQKRVDAAREFLRTR